jgi:hypothetical protein
MECVSSISLASSLSPGKSTLIRTEPDSRAFKQAHGHLEPAQAELLGDRQL